jgi:hypothetical protein
MFLSYQSPLTPTSKRALNADNGGAFACAAANLHRCCTRNSQDKDTSIVSLSQYNQPFDSPSLLFLPPPLVVAYPNILTNRRPANSLPLGKQLISTFLDPTLEKAMWLGLPAPVQQVSGALPPPQAWIRLTRDVRVPYDVHHPYEVRFDQAKQSNMC